MNYQQFMESVQRHFNDNYAGNSDSDYDFHMDTDKTGLEVIVEIHSKNKKVIHGYRINEKDIVIYDWTVRGLAKIYDSSDALLRKPFADVYICASGKGRGFDHYPELSYFVTVDDGSEKEAKNVADHIHRCIIRIFEEME